MPAFITPCVFVLLLWWFSTGIILYLVRRSRSSFRWSFLGMTMLAVVAFGLLRIGAADASVSGAYLAFSCAILLWAWLEMGFLMGFLAGPRTQACDSGCSGIEHFWHGTQAVLYSDIATAGVIGAAYAASYQAPNRVAFWTLIILWVMRLSAKLNLFLGVKNLGEAFLPAHLKYLRSFFRRRAMNFLFPISVSAGSAACVALVLAYRTTEDPFRLTSLALMTSLLALALLEHWFMVLPLPSERLWSWAFHARTRPKRGRHTPKMMLAKDSAESTHSPPHSVRSTSLN